MRSLISLLLVAALPLTGMACESSDPEEKNLAPAGAGGSSGMAACDPAPALVQRDGASCMPLATDYRPRDNASADDMWPACISDDGVYHAFNPSVGSNARAAAFEEMSAKLGFGGTKAPTPQEFLDAKVAYSQPEGLQSRVARREDVHYPPAPKQCRDLSGEELAAYPDRCVSQNKIQPLVETALNEGALGKDPVLNAARVEAGLLWFFYVSVYKEMETCGTEDKEDCDSATGYYGGVQTRENPIGFGKYVKARSQQAHDRVWDGLLAGRCWRDLDQALPNADDAMRQRAMDQTDRATMRGLSLIVRERLENAKTCGAAWETGRILGRVLLREANVRDPGSAAKLQAELDRDGPESLDVESATGSLDTIFPCP
jgi:hypothetical protein